MEKRFIHRGAAVALSGHLIRVDASLAGWPICAQASSVLTVAGGECAASVKRYALRIAAPRKATLLAAAGLETYVQSTADLDKNTAMAKVRASIQSIVVDGGFSTGPLEAELKSTHGRSDRGPVITPANCFISDLKIGSALLEVTLDLSPFQQCGTKAKLAALYKKSKAFRKANYRRFNTAETETEIAQGRSGAYVVSLVDSLRWKTEPHPDVTLDGYTVVWKGFGRIVIGEMLITEFERRLTMLRMAFGSPMGGACGLAEVETNGNFMP